MPPNIQANLLAHDRVLFRIPGIRPVHAIVLLSRLLSPRHVEHSPPRRHLHLLQRQPARRQKLPNALPPRHAL